MASASKINMASIWTAITATVGAMLWMFDNFASASDVEEIQLDIAYGQYYDRLDDYEEAIDEGRQELAEEYKRQMERLKAMICEQDQKWERCSEADDG